MAEILTEAQLLATFSGPQPEQIAMANLIRTLFSLKEGTIAAGEPAAGTLGEELSAEVLVGAAVALVSGTPKTITSLEITPGDWDVFGVVTFVPAATTSITRLSQSISTTTNVHGNNKQRKQSKTAAVVPGATDTPIADTPTVRINISATTTYYLIADATFTVDTLSAYGYLRARRVR
jgi:hypothetical protein